MTADTNYEIILYRKGTAGSITMIYGGTESFVISGSRAWSKNENDIGELRFGLSNGSTIPALNFLSSSFAGWSGGVTGALQLGDYVKYSLYPTKTGTKTQVFYGKITKMAQGQDGVLYITAQDYLKVLSRENPKIIYDGYRDSLTKTATWADGLVVISGITDSDVVTPLASVKLLVDDSRLAMGADDGDGSDDIGNGLMAAQAFFATGDVVFGCNAVFHFGTAYAFEDVYCELCKDDSGVPGTVIASTSEPRAGSLPDNIDFDLTTSGVPVGVTKGKKYWLKFYCPVVGGSGWIGGLTIQSSGAANYIITSHLQWDLSAWNTISDSDLHVHVDEATTKTFESDQYEYDTGAGEIGIVDGIPLVVPTQTYVTPVRGLISYYYGTVTNQEIADALTELNTGLISVSSANQDATSGTFSTSGKKLLEALQELADQYMPSGTAGTWDGYQLVFAHYESAGSHYVKWGKRLTTADSSYVTFIYAEDGVVDEEHRIIDYSGLELRTDLRPPRVVVIGTDSSDNPICYTITDRALTDSFEARMEGFANTQKIVDENLVTMADVRAYGEGALAKYAFAIWEGAIVVSGVYPELIDLDTGSASFGSGKIITLNLSPLGIVAQKFKVKGVQVEANQTTITISNMDLAVMNAQKYYNLKANRTEAFFAPVGLVDNVYVAVFVDDTVSGSSYNMQLEDSSGTAITGLTQVPCVKHAVSAFNLNVYQGIFEADNGYSTPPYGIRYIKLYSGATAVATYDLYSGSAPIRDERFDKFETMRLIVDVMTKNS